MKFVLCARVILPVLGLCLTAACTDNRDSDYYSDWYSDGSSPIYRDCGLSTTHTKEASAVLDRASSSLHELVVCGGAQVSLSRTLFVAVLLSNAEAFGMDPETVGQIRKSAGMPTASPMKSLGDGRWRMNGVGQNVGNLAFDLWFHDETGKPSKADPTRLDSYLTGVKVGYTMTFEEMKAAPFQPNTYTFAWKSLGPLGGVLAGVRGEVPNPIVLQLSAMDLTAAADADGEPGQFGPFANLLELGLSTEVQFDDLNSPRVTYRSGSPRQTVRRAAQQSLVDFQLLGLSGATGSTALDLKGATLTYQGSWNGALQGSMRGVLASGGTKRNVEFGFYGNLYPSIKLDCN